MGCFYSYLAILVVKVALICIFQKIVKWKHLVTLKLVKIGRSTLFTFKYLTNQSWSWFVSHQSFEIRSIKPSPCIKRNYVDKIRQESGRNHKIGPTEEWCHQGCKVAKTTFFKSRKVKFSIFEPIRSKVKWCWSPRHWCRFQWYHQTEGAKIQEFRKHRQTST